MLGVLRSFLLSADHGQVYGPGRQTQQQLRQGGVGGGHGVEEPQEALLRLAQRGRAQAGLLQRPGRLWENSGRQ